MCCDFEYFFDCLIRACESIGNHYFKIEVAGSKELIYRERVYCYELYHQLRNVLGVDFPYKLDGELDKINHPELQSFIKDKKPDFVVHVPGDMERNLVVIEVKAISTRIKRLQDDLKTLQIFLDKAKYYRAIMLIYGNDKSSNIERIKGEFKVFSNDQILLVWHKEPMEKPQLLDI